jgi:hypothetical protein
MGVKRQARGLFNQQPDKQWTKMPVSTNRTVAWLFLIPSTMSLTELWTKARRKTILIIYVPGFTFPSRWRYLASTGSDFNVDYIAGY